MTEYRNTRGLLRKTPLRQNGKEAGAALTVRAADGRQLFTTPVLSSGSSVTLNTGNMPIGLYIVELRNNDGLLKATKLSVNH